MARASWLVCLALVSCEHRPPAPGAVKSAQRATNAVSAPSALSSASAAATPITVRLASVPGPNGRGWNVVALAPEIGLDVPLAPFEPPRLCAIVQRPSPLGKDPPRLWLTCPGQPARRVGLEAGQLFLGNAGPTPAPHRAVRLAEDVEQPAVDCARGAPARPVEVSLTRNLVSRPPATGEPGDSKYAFGLRIGSDALLLTEVAKRAMSCAGSRVFAGTTSYEEVCSWGEAGARIRVEWESSNLWVTWIDTGYAKDSPRLRFGYRLACGERPVLRALTLRDPDFRPFGSPCADRCRIHEVSCADACYARFADQEGALSPHGGTCLNTCQAQQVRCDASCASTPKRR
jgi:hypothetical protein